MRIGFIIILAATMLVSCKSGKEIIKTQENRQMVKNTQSADIQPFYTVNSASITGNVLTASITFTGNKEIPEFDLVWNGMLMKSLPPKAAVVIVPKGKQPQGKNKVTLTLSFQLTDFEKNGYDETVIMLKGFDEQLRFINTTK